MAVLAILGLAIGLQVITAVVVRRLIRVTGRPWVWVSLAAVVVLLTGWRCAMVLRGSSQASRRSLTWQPKDWCC